MINGNDNTLVIQGNCCQNRLVNFIARKYKWPDYPLAVAPEVVRSVAIEPTVASAVTGATSFRTRQ
jgi:hypothetical protein